MLQGYADVDGLRNGHSHIDSEDLGGYIDGVDLGMCIGSLRLAHQVLYQKSRDHRRRW
jgi:hypothetical protein